MSLSASIIARTELVLVATLSLLGLETDRWISLVPEACTYWEGLLRVGEEEFGHFGIYKDIAPEDEAQHYIDHGLIGRSVTPEDLQQYTRFLIQKYFVLGVDAYGELLTEYEDEEEFIEYYSDEEEE